MSNAFNGKYLCCFDMIGSYFNLQDHGDKLFSLTSLINLTNQQPYLRYAIQHQYLEESISVSIPSF